MKKALLSLFFILAMNIMMAQQRAILPLELKDFSVRSEYVRPYVVNPDLPVFKILDPTVAVFKNAPVVEENVIGVTYYDLQSNSLLQNRIHCYDDGTVGAVWTMGFTATAFPDRGTGYNYFNGSAWGPQPTQRIETLRTGWPSYAPWGPNGEIVVSHDFSGYKLYFNTRPVKGTGSWTQALFTYSNGPATLVWPRMITSGEDHNIVHLLACTYGEYQGQAVGIVYSRSLDGGTTWDIENEVIDGTGAEYYTEINADQYVWANPVGNTIAFLVAGAWHDMFMMKSTDNGDSWEKTVIWEHPYPMFDWNVTVTDTFFCVDNSAAIALDSQGKAHVTFGINRVIHAEVGTTYNYFPYVDGIGYWNEDMPVFSNDLDALAPPQYGYANSEMIEDYNYIGYTQDVDGDGEITFINTSTGFPKSYRELGVSTMPTISVGPDGWVAIVYSSTTETYDNSQWNFKKLWMRDKPAGQGWSPFQHLTEDIFHIFDESVYAVAFPTWEDEIRLIYNNDAGPGTALDSDHDYIENRITYMKATPFSVGIRENHPSTAAIPSFMIYPNPASDKVRIDYTVSRASDVMLAISDISGRILVNREMGWRPEGNYTLSYSIENLPPGVYFVCLNTGNERLTRKLIVK